jgi:hypothetical protein
VSPDQIEKAVADRVGEIIIAHWKDGQSARARVTSVDQEGFTCYVLDQPDIEPTVKQWWRFDELTNVDSA